METNGRLTWLCSTKYVLQLHHCPGTKGNIIIVVLLSLPISKAKAKKSGCYFCRGELAEVSV